MITENGDVEYKITIFQHSVQKEFMSLILILANDNCNDS